MLSPWIELNNAVVRKKMIEMEMKVVFTFLQNFLHVMFFFHLTICPANRITQSLSFSSSFLAFCGLAEKTITKKETLCTQD